MKKIAETSKEENHPDHASEAASTDTSMRRKLVKGLIAGIPAVVTLKSGFASAGTSSACITSTPNASTPTSVSNRCVVGDTTAATEWKREQESTYFGVDMDASDGDLTASADIYCAVYVDDGGNEASANNGGSNYFGATGSSSGDPDTNWYAITNTCWSSFI
ncbi:hypothetical protein ACQZV8_06535 [Magnetococcales bacterium HHB-1]